MSSFNELFHRNIKKSFKKNSIIPCGVTDPKVAVALSKFELDMHLPFWFPFFGGGGGCWY